MRLVAVCGSVLAALVAVVAADDEKAIPLHAYSLRPPYLASSWEIQFQFKVKHESTTSGDGFAFWYTKERAKEGGTFGNQDDFEGLAVIFDTYANSNARRIFPYIMGMVNDGKIKYDHDFDGHSSEAGGCFGDFRNKDYPTLARVRYVANSYVKLELSIGGPIEEWRECFKIDNVSLPKLGFFGFTAITGGVSSAHDIIEVSTSALINVREGDESKASSRKVGDDQNLKAASSDKETAPKTNASPVAKPDTSRNDPSRHHPSNNASVSTFFYIVFAVIIAGLGYVGWLFYRSSKSNSYKRF
eukprot:jgi/Hompol1/508/HPOL_005338-RA